MKKTMRAILLAAAALISMVGLPAIPQDAPAVSETELKVRKILAGMPEKSRNVLFQAVKSEFEGEEPSTFPDRETALNSIRASELLEYEAYLASDKCGGRGTLDAAISESANYIAAKFKEAGLKPGGKGDSYLQKFDMGRRTMMEPTHILLKSSADPKGSTIGRLEMRKLGFSAFEFSASDKCTGGVVFVGYGITATDLDYDDYAGIDVKGKIVVVLRHEPRETDPQSAFSGAELTKDAFLVNKAKTAEEHGAAGMLLVTDPNNHKSTLPFSTASLLPKDIPAELKKVARKECGVDPGEEEDPAQSMQSRGEMYRASSETSGIPCAHISVAAADEILRPAGKGGVALLQKQIDDAMKPASFEVPGRFVEVCVTVQKGPQEAANVVGYAEGSDEKLKKEVIVIGAHYDHMGRSGKTVFYGADDNASGTAVMMELAEAFGKLAQRPKRTVLFVAFTGEELGLIGASQYASNPVLPIEDTVCMINLDMISRNKDDETDILYSKSGSELRKALEDADAKVPQKLNFKDNRVSGSSDHYPFYEKKVPVAFVHSGMHGDYHKASDTLDKMLPQKMRWEGRLIFDVICTLGDADKRPTFSDQSDKKK
jgi:hypothetical protein